MATRNYIGPWANRIDFCKNMLGGPREVLASGTYTYLSRQLPHVYPVDQRIVDRPIGTPLFATKIVRVQGVGVPAAGAATYEETSSYRGAIAVYNMARVTVQYETHPYEIMDDTDLQAVGGVRHESTLARYVTKVSEPSVEFRTAPMGSYKYVPGGQPIEMGLHKLFVYANIQLTWHEVPDYAVPSALHNPFLSSISYIDECYGRVNNAAFRNYPAGTLLFMGAKFRPYRLAFPYKSKHVYDITYLFKYYRPSSGVNHQYVFTTLSTPGIGYHEATTTGATNLGSMTDGVSIYDWYDFTKLFTPVNV